MSRADEWASIHYSEPPWVAETMARFSQLFQGLEDFNFDCGEGWRGPLTGLCERLEALERPGLRTGQIKEKLGGPRVTLEGDDGGPAWALVREAEVLSHSVCEACGALCAKDLDTC